jgi:hypothetical protein
MVERSRAYFAIGARLLIIETLLTSVVPGSTLKTGMKAVLRFAVVFAAVGLSVSGGINWTKVRLEPNPRNPGFSWLYNALCT